MTENAGRVPESFVSYVLIGGLALSVAAEVFGILLYYAQTGGFDYQFSSQWQMTGPNFFGYTYSLLASFSTFNPIAMMALGVVILMFTSYARVFTTLLHFAFVRNLKYVMISIFLFVVLTITLYAH